jgi:hypothetical protein
MKEFRSLIVILDNPLRPNPLAQTFKVENYDGGLYYHWVRFILFPRRAAIFQLRYI